MPSGHSVLEYTGDGVTDTFAVNFTLGYIDKLHIQCRVGDEVDGGGNPVYRVLADIPGDPGRMRITGSVPSVGVKIMFRRITPKSILQNDFSDGSALEDTALDDSFKQPIMIAHELLDGFGLSTVYSDMNMTGHKINNVLVDINDPTSLVTVGMIGDAAGQAAAADAARVLAEAARDTSIAAKDDSVAASAASEVARAAAVVAKDEAISTVANKVDLGVFTAAWDFIVGSGPAVAVKKTVQEVWAQLTSMVGAYTKQQYAVPVPITTTGVVTLDADLHQDVMITGAGDITFTQPNNASVGKCIFLTLFATTARNITWNSAFASSSGGALPTVFTVGKRMFLNFRFDGEKWVLLGTTERV